MHITIFRSITISTFIFIANISAMQQQKNYTSLELVTTRTNFNQFGSDELRTLASTSKQFRDKLQNCFPQIWEVMLKETGLGLFNTYRKDKDLHPDCIFLHCVYTSNYDAVKWLLENKAINPLCMFNSQEWPIILNGHHVAHKKNDNTMLELLGPNPLDETAEADSYHYNHPLIVEAACAGNQSLIKKNYNAQTIYFDDIDLVICAAIKNKDISFLKELCVHESFKKQMLIHNDHYLYYACTKRTVNPEDPYNCRMLCFSPTKEDAIFLKNLIESGCFKSTSSLIFDLALFNSRKKHIGLFDIMLDVLRLTREPFTTQ